MFSRLMFTRSAVHAAKPFRSTVLATQTRNLNIHEYQSQALMRKHNVTVPDGDAASTIEEAAEIATKLG